ncbi:MAG: helix-turn-helix domain-containing protein [Thermoanaerobaculia bacterium]
MRAEKFSAAERAALDRAFEQELLDMDLRQIREMTGHTQAGLAKAASMTQPEISRLESQGGAARLATLRRLIEGLGGELEVIATFGDKRVRLRAVG